MNKPWPHRRTPAQRIDALEAQVGTLWRIIERIADPRDPAHHPTPAPIPPEQQGGFTLARPDPPIGIPGIVDEEFGRYLEAHGG